MKIKPTLIIALSFGFALAGCHAPLKPIIKPLEIKGGKASIPTPEGDVVRIGIRVDVDKATIEAPVEIRVTVDGAQKESWPPGTFVFTARNGRLELDGHAVGQKIRLSTRADGGFLKCGANDYRGDLVVVARQDNITVINDVNIDDYLKGVLPREAVVTWPDDALRAQAVASRTYLASHLGTHGSKGFDLCSDVHCQVYGGMTKENPRTNDAADATRGLILVYNGKPISAFFSADCGGWTEDPKSVWGSDSKPYLPRKRCGYCNNYPRFKWEKTLTNDEIMASLTKNTRVRGKRLDYVRVKKKSSSGRAEIVGVATNVDKYDLTGNEFRLALHPERIRSTLFTEVTKLKNGYHFEGRGWGHGVGMCQWGAKSQAEAGRSFRQILSFYYPHAELETWKRQ